MIALSSVSPPFGEMNSALSKPPADRRQITRKIPGPISPTIVKVAEWLQTGISFCAWLLHQSTTSRAVRTAAVPCSAMPREGATVHNPIEFFIKGGRRYIPVAFRRLSCDALERALERRLTEDDQLPRIAKRAAELAATGDFEGFNALTVALKTEFDDADIGRLRRDSEARNAINDACQTAWYRKHGR